MLLEYISKINSSVAVIPFFSFHAFHNQSHIFYFNFQKTWFKKDAQIEEKIELAGPQIQVENCKHMQVYKYWHDY
jgi:hypothetical protein